MKHRQQLWIGLIVLVLGLLTMGTGPNANAATLFSEDFEDGNSTGWSTSNGSWSVVTDGNRVYKQSSTSTTAHAYNGTASWAAYSVQARVKALSFNGTARYFGLLARYQSSSNYYFLALSNAGTLEIRKKVGGSVTVLASKSYTVATGTWYTLKFDLNGNALQAYVNGILELSAMDSSFTAGKIGCTTYNASAEFDDILVDGVGAVTPTPTPSSATPTPTPSTATPTPTPSTATPTPTPSSATPTPATTPTPTSSPVVGEFYVSPSGNDSNPGTIAQPFYSLAKAVAIAGPGSTIYMRGGTYQYTATINLTQAGTAAAPIKILAYQNEKPVLSWSTWAPASETIRGAARGIKVTMTASYYYIKGLEIAYAPDNGVKCEGNHITFDQCVFHHNGDSGIQIGLNKDDYDANPDPEHYAAYNSVINCDSYRNADPATSYENADGFACKLYAGKDNYFYGCRAWENADDGWDCYQTNYLITIENCWTWHNGDPAIWGLSSFSGDGNGFKLGGDDAPCPILVKNCVAFDLPYGACSGFSDNNNGQAVTIYNSVAWKCGRSFNMNEQPHVIKNCVDFDSTRLAPRDFDSQVIHEYNSWNLSGIVANYDDFISTNVSDAIAARQADGSLPDNGFAKLKAGSDLINKGVNVGIPYYGTAPDLGAYESNY